SNAFPQATAYRHDQALSYLGLGASAQATGQTEQAAKAYRKALDLLQPSAGAAAEIPEHQYARATALNRLGDLQRETSQIAQAEADYRAAQGILELLVGNQPRVP